MSCKSKIKELLHVVWHSFTNPKNSGAISILSYPEQVFTNLAHKCKPHMQNPSPLTSTSIPLIVKNAYDDKFKKMKSFFGQHTYIVTGYYNILGLCSTMDSVVYV